MKILAIDDKQDNLTTLTAVVREALPDCTLLTALNGLQGIERARTEDPDVILLDIVMPGMDGFEVCRRLKADELLRSIPVVFLTALRTDRESRVKALEVGAEAFLSKPLDELELLAEVRAMTKLKAANRLQQLEKEQLAALVADRTRELEQELALRKQAEEHLRATNAQLAQTLAQAEELAVRAEAANRAKSEFLANMSHELRTPMTAILGCSELLNTEEFSPTEQHTFLQTIQRSGEGLLGIINDILDLARIEADQLPLQKTDCPLQPILNDVLAVARIAAAKKCLSLQMAYGLPVPATICTDPARLRQILVNLVGNAVKFTEQGEVRLSVHCCKTGEGTAQVQFAVSDTGIGIPSAMLEEIFQPFVQVDGRHTRRYGGTGLGLSICQRLAEALDGRLEVTSEVGRGSTFTLTVDGGPWQKTQGPGASSDQAAGPTSRAEPGGEPSLVLQGRVLLVEDEPTLQVILGHLLRRLKLEVELADDGRLACQMAEQSRSEGRPYELILMDLQLPDMDGLDATRWLRTQGWPGPIVALTAHAMLGDREKCLAAGCDDYLSKPISTSALREVLTRCLRA